MAHPIDAASSDEEVLAALNVSSPSSAAMSYAISLRTMLAVCGLVMVADLTLYSHQGFASVASFLLAAPCLLAIGMQSIRVNRWLLLVSVALLLASIRLCWQGHAGLVAMGLCLVAAFAMSLHSIIPYIGDLIRFIVAAPIAGLGSLLAQSSESKRSSTYQIEIQWFAIGLPILATSVFAAIFVMANPDLQSLFSHQLTNLWNYVRDWINGFSVGQSLFWILVALLSLGFYFPHRTHYPTWPDNTPLPSAINQSSVWFAPLRNMLMAVSVLFAVYLTYEFYTLWFREFPKGFYYAGYAHEGAAWLTVALALSTAVLSASLQGEVLADTRISELRRWAWVWSILNLVLAVAVYHRLSIYIDFNGMTRMRTIGLFGVTCVLAGFIWVMLKINHRRSFVWLVQRQLWTLAAAVFLYLLTPVDVIVHAFNVRQILAGHLAPSVQITEHPLSDEGMMMLPPLLDCQDATIREGIRAMLATRHDQLAATTPGQIHWTAFQCSTHFLQNHLDSLAGYWPHFTADKVRRDTAYKEFKAYAFQWY
jgi:Domain of unknown function (DUF4173)